VILTFMLNSVPFVQKLTIAVRLNANSIIMIIVVVVLNLVVDVLNLAVRWRSQWLHHFIGFDTDNSDLQGLYMLSSTTLTNLS
jgi:hypothetical protein